MSRRIIIIFVSFLILAPLSGQERHIHSIGELNRKSGIDTHLKENRYRLEPDYRTIVELGRDELGHPKLHYPRVKQLSDGSYIMFYQSGRIGTHCYCAYSTDCISWERGPRVFEAYDIVNSAGEPDRKAYSTTDAVVLPNGDILAFAAFRAVKGYKKCPQDDGLAVRRSTDGGRTWGEEKVIYTSIVWEPFALCLPSGEIQVYFTDSDHDWTPPSSGVTMLRSTDGGETWTTQCQVIRQYRATASRADGSEGKRKVWTDQMPSVCLLGDGKTLLAAVESCDSTNHYSLSLVSDDTNWATTLTGDMTGPAKRRNNFRSGGGPYLSHFPSGETALSFQGYFFNIKLGLSSFESIVKSRAFQPFGQRISLWGSTTVTDPHTLIAAAPSLDTKKDAGTIMVGKMRLNHRVDAPYAHIRIDADNIDWADNTDAIFLGSESPAQCCFRFAYDETSLYVLIEYLDSDIIPRDKISLKFGNGQNEYNIFSTYVEYNGRNVQADRFVDSRIYTEPGRGYMVEMAIPRSELPFVQDRIFFYPEILKAGITDRLTEVGPKEYYAWMPVRIIE